MKTAAAAALVAMLLAGCSGGAAKALLDPMEQARTAVKSEQLAFELLDGHQVTTSVAQVVLDDMTDELTSAEKSIHGASVADAADEALRDTALEAAREATSASLASRDCLSSGSSCTEARAQLQTSADGVQAVLDQLESSR